LHLPESAGSVFKTAGFNHSPIPPVTILPEPEDYAIFSGNKPGIQRDARAAGKVRRSGARGLSDTSTPLPRKADTSAGRVGLLEAGNSPLVAGDVGEPHPAREEMSAGKSGSTASGKLHRT